MGGSAIWERGVDLYESGAVTNLVEESGGRWTANVQGTYRYRLWIKLDGEEIEDFECNCPYDHGPVCKHIVAMSLAMEEGGQTKGAQSQNVKSDAIEFSSVRESIERRSKKIKKKDLLEFVINICEQDENAWESFQLRFPDSKERVSPPDYHQMIAKAAREAEDDWGFLEEDYIEDILEKLNLRAENAIKGEQWEDLFMICRAVLLDIPSLMERIPEYIVGVEDEVYQTIDHLSNLYDLPTDQGLEVRARELTINLLASPDIGTWGFDSPLIEGLVGISLTGEQQEMLLANLDQVIKKNEQESGSSIWELGNWVQLKADFLKKYHGDNMGYDFLQKYSAIPKIRKLLIEKEMQAGMYHRAKQLIREGIQVADQSGYAGTVCDWQEDLLNIATIEEDQSAIRLLSEQLFWNGRGAFKYYDRLKSTYTSEEWKEKVEKIITEIWGDGKGRSFRDTKRIATIFRKEELYDRLFELLKTQNRNYHLLDEYSTFLPEDYQFRLLPAFRAIIENYAGRDTGRAHYHEVVRMLKRMGQISGGEPIARSLVSSFRVQYRRRPAMMEILSEEFPESERE